MGRAALPEIDAAAIEAGRRLFAAPCAFVAGAARYDQLPPARLPEVAFAGRSNVGKSSLLNALTGRATLARVSRTPGRTQQINFFDLGGRLMLADLPGYGYARAPRGEIRRWRGLVHDYLLGRPNLRRVALLVDSRHGPKAGDDEVMDALDEAAVSYLVVLTKTDKIATAELARLERHLGRTLAARAAAYLRIVATSAATGAGLALLRAELGTLAHPAEMG